MFLYKKYNKKYLQLLFFERWLVSYSNNIIIYDMIYKFPFLNLYQLLQLINKLKSTLSFDITSDIKRLYEISETLKIFNDLLGQKPLIISNNITGSYVIQINLLKANFMKFLHFFSCYIYPLILKRQSGVFTSHAIDDFNQFFYLFNEFHLYLDPKYDILENKSMKYTINSSIGFQKFKKKDSQTFLPIFLSSFNL